MSKERRDNIEVRLHNDGTLDEVVMYDHNNKCIFHLEQMDDHYYWMRFQGVTQDLVVYITASVGEVDQPIWDENNRFVREEKVQGPKTVGSYQWDEAVHESETHEQYRTPAAQRQAEVEELVNKYGIKVLLQELIGVYEKGRKADHELQLIKDLQVTYEHWVTGDREYWDKIMEEVEHERPS